MPPRALLPLAVLCLAIVTAGCGRNEPASAAVPAVLTRQAVIASAGLAVYTGEIRARRSGILFMPLYQGLGDDGFFTGRALAIDNE